MKHKDKSECHKLLGQISDLIDGDLSPNLCVELEEHLKECQNCRIVLNTTKRTIELYHDADQQVEFPIGSKERLFKRLNLDQLSKEK